MLGLAFFLDLIDEEEEKKRFEQFYYYYEKYMYSTAKKYVHTHHLSEEVMQDAYLYFATNFKKIGKTGSPATTKFVKVCTKGIACSKFKKEKFFYKVELEDYMVPVDDSEFDLIDTITLNQAISKVLSDLDQSIIEMKFTTGLKSKEIAQILKMSDDSIRKRIQRAKYKLKKDVNK